MQKVRFSTLSKQLTISENEELKALTKNKLATEKIRCKEGKREQKAILQAVAASDKSIEGILEFVQLGASSSTSL